MADLLRLELLPGCWRGKQSCPRGDAATERRVLACTVPSVPLSFLSLAQSRRHCDRLPFQFPCPSFAGRAWLYLALNENSLESYLRLFQENLALLHKYYVK